MPKIIYPYLRHNKIKIDQQKNGQMFVKYFWHIFFYIKYPFFAKEIRALSIEASEGPVENPDFDLMMLFSKIEPLW